MKIAWATPWNAKSAIATFSRFVIDELTVRGIDVDVLRVESGFAAELPPLPLPPGKTARFVSEVNPRELINGYDAVFANMGDYLFFHEQAFELLETVPCITILHDADMSSMAWHLCTLYGQEGQEPGLRNAVSTLYNWNVEDRSNRLMQWIGARSTGGIVHSSYYFDGFARYCSGNVIMAPLAYPSLGEVAAKPLEADRLTVATVGMVNPNKRVSEVMRALSLSWHLSGRVKYKVIGAVSDDDRRQFDRYAEELGIAPVAFTGWVDDEELKRQLETVDVISCLRSPVTEGGSASLILGMYAGRPVLVSDHGCYADIPDEFVLKCRPGHEALDLVRHLENLLISPHLCRVIGEAAREFAKKRFVAGGYVDSALALIPGAAQLQPSVMAGNMTGRILGCLDTHEDDPLIARLSHNMAEMLGEA